MLFVKKSAQINLITTIWKSLQKKNFYSINYLLDPFEMTFPAKTSKFGLDPTLAVHYLQEILVLIISFRVFPLLCASPYPKGFQTVLYHLSSVKAYITAGLLAGLEFHIPHQEKNLLLVGSHAWSLVILTPPGFFFPILPFKTTFFPRKGNGMLPKMLATRTAEKVCQPSTRKNLWSSPPRVKRPNLIKRATRKILRQLQLHWRVIYPKGPGWHQFFPGERVRNQVVETPKVWRGGIPSWRGKHLWAWRLEKKTAARSFRDDFDNL